MSASKMLCQFLFAALMLALASSAMAQEAPWYAGAGVGASGAKIDDSRIEAGLRTSGFATTSIQDQSSDTGYKLFGGYQFTPNFALEGSYFGLGKFGFHADTNPAGSLTGSARFQGVALDAIGRLPVSDQLSLYGRLGVTDIRTSDDFSGTGNVDVLESHVSQHGANYKFGVGAQYALSRAWSLRAEVERYRVGDAVGNHGDIDLFSLSLVYQFGARAPVASPAPPVSAPPAPVAVVTPPVPIAPKPSTRTVVISADSLFQFAKAELSPSGKQALDQFTVDIKGAAISLISITGHTDRLGSAALNLTLSQRRADVVKDYLVTSTGLAPERFSAVGVDGQQPVTAPGLCVGSRPTPALIGCLQPDRRVEVQVTSTK